MQKTSLKKYFAALAVTFVASVSFIGLHPLPASAQDSCPGGGFFGFPTWYKYLPQQPTAGGGCRPKMTSIYDLWLVVAAIIDILLRIASLAALVFVVWGGVKYIQSRGDPNLTKEAKQTIINGIIGMVIAVAASAVVAFIASRFG